MSALKRLAFEEVYVGGLGGTYSKIFNLEYSTGFAIIASATDTTPSPFTFLPTDILMSMFIIKNNHGCETGLKVRFSSSGTLPSGLSAGVDYYLIRNTSDALEVASSLQNAFDGVGITFGSDGTGTHTITPEAAVTPTITLEASLDLEVWAPISGINVPLTATPYLIESETAYYHYLKVIVNVEGGQYNLYSKLMSKGQQI